MTIDISKNSERDRNDLPCESWASLPIIRTDGILGLEFRGLTTKVVATEPEEVGVEHLLRDMKSATIDLSEAAKTKADSLKMVQMRVQRIIGYLKDVLSGKLQPNENILRNLQTIFN